MAPPSSSSLALNTADLDLDRIATARRQFDPVGHYARPDVFSLTVNSSPKPAVTFSPDPP